MRFLSRRATLSAVVVLGTGFGGPVAAASAYDPITRSATGKTITLDGRHMTFDQVVAIARHGARVKLTPGARKRSSDAYGLLLQGAAEGVPIYWFNRIPGAGREQWLFQGDPLSPENKAFIERNQLASFGFGTRFGLGPEVAKEEIVRAMMAVRANTMTYEAASPQLTQMLLDLLNRDVTPVVYSRGTPGEGDLPQMTHVAATMVGVGHAYFRGRRMTAARALAAAGLKPLQPFGADDAALTSTNAFTVGQAVLLAVDGKRALNWADAIHALNLLGMNSSVTPISAPVQSARPFPWLNFAAKRALGLIRGSYLFEADPNRIIQDPESLRASSQRQGSAWQALDVLGDDLQIQINSSDHNPVVAVGWSPDDRPELRTPWFMQYYVKGGPHSNGQHGYILSNANWEPINIDNQIEAFTNALANMDAAIGQRIQRFSSTFFTVISPSDVLSAEVREKAAPGSNDYNIADLIAEIQTLNHPVPAQGNAIVGNVEDLQAAGRIKVTLSRAVLDNTFYLLGEDLLNATYWLEVRRAQDPTRSFGVGAQAAWDAFRRVVPWQADPAGRPNVPPVHLAYGFMLANDAAPFFRTNSGKTAAAYRAGLRQAVRMAKVRTTRFMREEGRTLRAAR